MPFSNPTPSIAYASHLGARTPSSAAPLPHAHPVTPFANPPCNEQQTTNDKPQTTSNEPSRAPHFALFLQILHIASTVIVAIAKRMDSDLHCLTLLQGCEAINCLYAIIRIQLTIDRHPERITPDELRRLAKASRYINRLARRKLDFSLFSTGSADVPSAPAPADQPASPSPNNPQSPIRNPQLSLPRLNLNGLPSTSVCHSPGATLARTCQSLCRLLKLLPDLDYDPSGTVPTLDLANPATLSLTLGARTPSSAIPLPPTNSFTSSPTTPPPPGARASSPASTPTPVNSFTPSSNSPFNEQQTTNNARPQATSNKPQTTNNELFPTPASPAAASAPT